MLQFEDYISFEQAKALKELGFDWWGDYIYNDGHLYPVYILSYDYKERETCMPAPALAQVQKWLREIKGIEFWIDVEIVDNGLEGFEHGADCDYSAYIFDKNMFKYINEGYITRSTYEHAFLAGIDEVIRYLKEL